MRLAPSILAFLAAGAVPCLQAFAEGPFQLRGHEGGITSLEFSPNDKWLASSGPSFVKVWDVETRKSIFSYNSGDGCVFGGATFSPDGKLLAAHGMEGTSTTAPRHIRQVVNIWETANWQKKQTIDVPTPTDRRPWGHIVFMPDGNRVFWGDWNSNTRNLGYRYFIGDVTTGQIVTELPHRNSEHPFAVTRDGKRLIHGVVSVPGNFEILSSEIAVWEIGSPDESTRRAVVDGPITDLAISPNGQRIAVAAGGDYQRRQPGTVWLYDLDNASAEPLPLEGHRGMVQAVAFSPGGRVLASGGRDHIIRLWEAHTGKLVRELRGHTTGVVSLAISPDGKWLASGGAEGEATIRLWKLPDDLVDEPVGDN